MQLMRNWNHFTVVLPRLRPSFLHLLLYRLNSQVIFSYSNPNVCCGKKGWVRINNTQYKNPHIYVWKRYHKTRAVKILRLGCISSHFVYNKSVTKVLLVLWQLTLQLPHSHSATSPTTQCKEQTCFLLFPYFLF